MELDQVFSNAIPQKKKIYMLLQSQESQDISKKFLSIIKTMIKTTKDVKMVNGFCIQLYDMMYYEIMFNKIRIAKKILRVFEELALPIKYIGEEKWKDTLKRMKNIKL